MTKLFLLTATIAAGLHLSAMGAESGEEKVSLEKVPAPVAKALKEHAGSDKITNLSRETEKGKTVYEASFKRNGRAHDLTVDESGKLVSDEEVIPTTEA